jgi:pyruvate,orthophosphate dikinase
MIETPRAALMAADLARVSQFLSFGTNDLTQFTWACSRDLAEGELFSKGAYSDLCFHPFTVFDEEGLGTLMRVAVTSAREAVPAIPIGVCGEYGSDPRAIHFFLRIGVNYVSCSPFSVPIARLVSGQLAARKDYSDG